MFAKYSCNVSEKILHMRPSCMINRTRKGLISYCNTPNRLARRCLHQNAETGNLDSSTKKTIIKIRPVPAPRVTVTLPPPEALDSDFRSVLGTVMLPSILKSRMQNLLRKESGKSRVGIEKFISKHQYEFEKNSQGRRDFPFTRGI